MSTLGTQAGLIDILDRVKTTLQPIVFLLFAKDIPSQRDTLLCRMPAADEAGLPLQSHHTGGHRPSAPLPLRSQYLFLINCALCQIKFLLWSVEISRDLLMLYMLFMRTIIRWFIVAI